MNLRKFPIKGFGRRYCGTFKADKYYIYRALGLDAFSDIELKKSYSEVFSRDSKGDLKVGLKTLLTKKAASHINNSHDEAYIDEKVRHIATFLTEKEPVEHSVFNPFTWAAASQPSDEKKEEKGEKNVPSSSSAPTSSHNPTLSFDEFKSRLRKSAERLDPKLPAVVASAVLTGTSIGVIIPCMPILVQTIGMPPSEFGLVVAAFGISKMFGNIPSAYFVETYGRKPVMVAGLALCGLGIGGVGLTLVDGFGTPWLIGCRLVSGLGVSAFTGGTFMLLSDISTSLNRTRTPASVMAGFQSGVALGPALGGVMVGSMGIGPTYFTVGGLFAIMASLNHMFLTETMPGKTLYQKRADEKKNEERLALLKLSAPAIEINTVSAGGAVGGAGVGSIGGVSSVGGVIGGGGVGGVIVNKKATIADVGIAGSFRVALLSWKELMKVTAVRDVMFIHGAYWAAIAGTQMTLLPLMMVGPGLHLGASEIGMTFAFISLTGVAASQPVAYLADRHGKLNCMLGGCALVATAMAVLPHADSFYYILAASVPLSVGSTTMGASPVALVTDLVSKEDRAQALALLRTSSDVGLLIGATAGGIIADVFSIESAITGYSALMAVSTVWFAYRTIGVRGLVTFLGLGGEEKIVSESASTGVKEGKDVAVEYGMTKQPSETVVPVSTAGYTVGSPVHSSTSAVVAVDTHGSIDRLGKSAVADCKKSKLVGSTEGSREGSSESISASASSTNSTMR